MQEKEATKEEVAEVFQLEEAEGEPAATEEEKNNEFNKIEEMLIKEL